MMRLHLTFLTATLFVLSAFGTGMTLFKIQCESKDEPIDNPTYLIHRYSQSAPGGPVHNALQITKTLGEKESSAQLMPSAKEEASPRTVSGTLIYTQWLTAAQKEAQVDSGYIHVYGGKDQSLLDIKLPSKSPVNTNGPLIDYVCKQTHPKMVNIK